MAENQKQQVEQRLQDALSQKQAANEQAQQARAELDAVLLEEEAQKQAVFYGISVDEARERIQQNERERAEGVERTIWPAPNQGGNT